RDLGGNIVRQDADHTVGFGLVHHLLQVGVRLTKSVDGAKPLRPLGPEVARRDQLQLPRMLPGVLRERGRMELLGVPAAAGDRNPEHRLSTSFSPALSTSNGR